MPSIPTKRARVLTTIETTARFKAEAKFKLSPKGLNLALVNMIERIDPLELLAVVAGTFMVYDIIKATPEMLAQAQLTFTDTAKNLFLGVFAPLYDAIFSPQTTLTPEQQAKFKEIRDTPDIVLFMKCFAISYIMIKHSGQIISGVGNMTGWIASFLGLKAV